MAPACQFIRVLRVVCRFDTASPMSISPCDINSF